VAPGAYATDPFVGNTVSVFAFGNHGSSWVEVQPVGDASRIQRRTRCLTCPAF